LVTITERKALNQARDQRRQKRDWRLLIELPQDANRSDINDLDAIRSPEPTPEVALVMAETLNGLMGLLDDELREMVRLRLEGLSNKEIGNRLGRPLPTVERRFRLIRARWKNWGAEHGAIDIE
jgi:DNA-directed RNA polymerase specialized sigma24 family protein